MAMVDREEEGQENAEEIPQQQLLKLKLIILAKVPPPTGMGKALTWIPVLLHFFTPLPPLH